jgi:uncharacterized glyoxalase superfamily protein PhnB
VTSDPLDALRIDLVSIDPHARFATELLLRIQGGEGPMRTENVTLPSVTPALHYSDADAALAWLTVMLGLTESWVHRSEEGRVDHAELRWGRGLVSINYRRGHYDRYGPTNVLLLADEPAHVDAAYQRAAAAGADIVRTPHEDPTGYGFTARDPEGNLWQISTDTLDPLRERHRGRP